MSNLDRAIKNALSSIKKKHPKAKDIAVSFWDDGTITVMYEIRTWYIAFAGNKKRFVEKYANLTLTSTNEPI